MQLKAMRLAKGWTQAELAERAGLAREYVLRLERGQQDPRLSIVLKLAKALRVKPAGLLE